MTPGEALDELTARGIRLFVRDGFLKYRGPVGAMTDEIRALVASHRGTFLRDWRCMSCERIVDTLYGFPPTPSPDFNLLPNGGRRLLCRDCAPRRSE